MMSDASQMIWNQQMMSGASQMIVSRMMMMSLVESGH